MTAALTNSHVVISFVNILQQMLYNIFDSVLLLQKCEKGQSARFCSTECSPEQNFKIVDRSLLKKWKEYG